MKVYGSPVSAPEYNFSDRNYDWQAADIAYEKAVEANLRERGYTGPWTGRIISFGVADGSASYMYASVPKGYKGRDHLVHLATGDAYQYRDVEFLPKAEVIRRLVKREGDPGYTPPLFGNSRDGGW